jgi:hypothetical protein
MAGVFDRLQEEIEDKQGAEGITALDMTELSPALRRIVRLLLRESQMNYLHLRDAVDAMPVEQRLSHAELNLVLDTLTRQYWLKRIGNGEHAIYKVNLRRRSGGSLPSGVWNTLDEKLKGKPK